MLQTKYVVTKHSYWEHYGATPIEEEYDNKEKADKALAQYDKYWGLEEGYYATLHIKHKIVLTPEDKEKQKMRKSSSLFDYKKQEDYGFCFLTSGSKKVYYSNENNIYVRTRGEWTPINLKEISHLKSMSHAFDELFENLPTPMFSM